MFGLRVKIYEHNTLTPHGEAWKLDIGPVSTDWLCVGSHLPRIALYHLAPWLHETAWNGKSYLFLKKKKEWKTCCYYYTTMHNTGLTHVDSAQHWAPVKQSWALSFLPFGFSLSFLSPAVLCAEHSWLQLAPTLGQHCGSLQRYNKLHWPSGCFITIQSFTYLQHNKYIWPCLFSARSPLYVWAWEDKKGFEVLNLEQYWKKERIMLSLIIQVLLSLQNVGLHFFKTYFSF